MKKYLYLIKNSKIPTYIKYWLMYSSKKVQTTLQSLPLMLESTIKDTIIKITKIYGNTEQATSETSPSPEFPSPVNNITGDVEITISNEDNTQEQNYPISLGGNEFKKENMILGSYINGNTGVIYASNSSNVSDYMSVIGGLEYTLDYSFTTLSSVSARAICYYDKNKTFIVPPDTYTYYPGNNPITIIPPINARYVRFTLDQNITDVSFSRNIETPIELCKIGNYQDYIYKQNGNWYKYGAIGKTILDGSENDWYEGSSGNTGNIKRFVIPLSSSKPSQSDTLLSNYFKGQTTYGLNIEGININSTSLLSVYKDEIDLATFKTWLSTHNTEVYYVLATPTTTQITDTTLINQLEAIQNIKAYEDITNISSDKEIKIDIDYIQRG